MRCSRPAAGLPEVRRVEVTPRIIGEGFLAATGGPAYAAAGAALAAAYGTDVVHHGQGASTPWSPPSSRASPTPR